MEKVASVSEYDDALAPVIIRPEMTIWSNSRANGEGSAEASDNSHRLGDKIVAEEMRVCPIQYEIG
jgi:hypothetical protein